ncbi:hypothetical protein EDB85DRAFT_1899667 [Lactarius pseudohatsudake]|nr:hypothetical protein EDB85DRAFT_1899667 [Lactarius pseudohatsudake]
MFASRGQSSLSRHSLSCCTSILLLLPVLLLLLSDADPTKTQYMRSPTRGVRRLLYYPGTHASTHASTHVPSGGWGWMWNSWGAGFLFPDLTPNHASAMDIGNTDDDGKATPTVVTRSRTSATSQRQQGSIDDDGDRRWQSYNEGVGLGSRGSDGDNDNDRTAAGRFGVQVRVWRV